MSNIDWLDFISAPNAGNLGFVYETTTQISTAKQYAMNASNVGAHKLRVLIKTVEMMMDPDMEDHLVKATRATCELMFDICHIIKGIKEGEDAVRGLQLVEAVKGLFTIGLCVPIDCPVIELFEEQVTRLQALNVQPEDGEEQSLSDEALAEEWLPVMADAELSSGDEGEAAWLESIALARSKSDALQSNEDGRVAPQPTKQAGLGMFFGNGVKKTYERVRLPDGSVRQQLAGSSVLQVKTVSLDSGAGKLWACIKGCGRTFEHGPGKKAHEKVCTYQPQCVDVEEDADDEAEAAAEEAAAEEAAAEEAAAEEMPGAPTPYPFDPPPCGTSNTAVHDAVANELGIDSSTPVEQYDDLLRANPTVLHRLALTEGLYALYERVAQRARELAPTLPFPLQKPVAEGADAGPSGQVPKRQKLLKDKSRFKQSGLKEGDKRSPRTIFFKYEVVKHYRRLQKLKEQGLCANPNDDTAEYFNVSKGQVSGWANQEEQLRAALLHVNVISGKGKRKKLGDEKLVPFTSRAARRCTLHKGALRPFAVAEAEVHALYREKRRKGLRVSGHILRVMMKKTVKKFYGEKVAAKFKASSAWLQRFTRAFDMSLRCKTNKKHLSIEERLPTCKRWHARFRRRLKGGPKEKLDPKWGRWLPEDRWSIDQVPCNLREGSNKTYADTGDKRIWLAGSKTDCGKRFCTLQVGARCANGDRKKPRCGQAKLTIAFRGQGASQSSPVQFLATAGLLAHLSILSSI